MEEYWKSVSSNPNNRHAERQREKLEKVWKVERSNYRTSILLLLKILELPETKKAINNCRSLVLVIGKVFQHQYVDTQLFTVMLYFIADNETFLMSLTEWGNGYKAIEILTLLVERALGHNVDHLSNHRALNSKEPSEHIAKCLPSALTAIRRFVENSVYVPKFLMQLVVLLPKILQSSASGLEKRLAIEAAKEVVMKRPDRKILKHSIVAALQPHTENRKIGRNVIELNLLLNSMMASEKSQLEGFDDDC